MEGVPIKILGQATLSLHTVVTAVLLIYVITYWW